MDQKDRELYLLRGHVLKFCDKGRQPGPPAPAVPSKKRRLLLRTLPLYFLLKKTKDEPKRAKAFNKIQSNITLQMYQLGKDV
jgi:hypothetical protein